VQDVKWAGLKVPSLRAPRSLDDCEGLDIHRAYYTWNQIGESGLQRAQRSGVAKGEGDQR
jgi:hypothetical protein